MLLDVFFNVILCESRQRKEQSRRDSVTRNPSQSKMYDIIIMVYLNLSSLLCHKETEMDVSHIYKKISRSTGRTKANDDDTSQDKRRRGKQRKGKGKKKRKARQGEVKRYCLLCQHEKSKK